MTIQDLIRAALRKAAREELQRIREANIEGVEPFDATKLTDQTDELLEQDNKPR